NVTVKVSFKGCQSLNIPQASPPTFLFLPYSIVKKQTHISVKTIKPKPESSASKDPTNSPSLPVFSRTKDIVASSAAALVSERTYRGTPQT
ncbi:hypothetical protein, partial [Agrobacterium sp. DSM 25558]|uniref:hypothetical protein n=1 Tax=Agrobacterium sp. DSM 25558 TaxID=1907665 RepID=UPI001AECAC91